MSPEFVALCRARQTILECASHPMTSIELELDESIVEHLNQVSTELGVSVDAVVNAMLMVVIEIHGGDSVHEEIHPEH